jgi:hypothetical protein
MSSDYVSQIVLIPQHADWRWYTPCARISKNTA